MKFNVVLIAVFLFVRIIPAQVNLVPNPSFEQYNRIPEVIGDAPGAIKDWTFASEGGSGDYYHAESPGPDYSTMDNYFGSEAPHSGEAYAGFCVTQTYREFLAAPLKEKLIKGQQYKFTMYISKGDHQDVSYLKEISVMFLSRKWILNNDLVMSLPPQIIFYQDSGFTYHNGWQELTAIYTAQGTEQWIYIGAHQWKCDTCKSVPGTPRIQSPGISGAASMHAHYYVDDVSLTALSETDHISPVITSEVSGDTASFFTIGKVYSFNNIRFATNSSELSGATQPVLDSIVAYLKINPVLTVRISGYTDNVGGDDANQQLSSDRANAVKDYFIAHGIVASRIIANGYGETRPVGDNTTEAGRALNRRVEFIFANMN